MTHDPNGAGSNPHAPRERHTVSITRMCLRSGSVQLPFALMDRLPEGEVLAVDAEHSEAMVLWSEPPRTLYGLSALFDRHELQVNDQLMLEPRDEELRITVQKRPRRSRPKVKASTWESMRDDAPSAAPDDGSEGAPPAAEASAREGEPSSDAGPSRVRVRGMGTPSEEEAPPSSGERPSSPPAWLDDQARRPPARPERDDEAEGPGWWGGLWRRARGLFGGGDAAPPAAERGAGEPREPDVDGRDAWARAWGDPPAEDPIAPAWSAGDAPVTGGPTADERSGAPEPAPEPQVRTRPLTPPPEASPPRRDEPIDLPEPSVLADDAEPEPPAEPSTPPEPRPEPAPTATVRPLDGPEAAPQPAPPRAPAGPGEEERAPGVEEAPRRPAGTGDVPDPPRPEPASSRETAAPDAPRGPAAGPTQPPGGPSAPERAERFLGGDLRTRLLRYLSTPEAPLIVGHEALAERFDLEPATALDMLDDIAKDPPPGLRLTPIREGTYRLERDRS